MLLRIRMEITACRKLHRDFNPKSNSRGDVQSPRRDSAPVERERRAGTPILREAKLQSSVPPEFSSCKAPLDEYLQLRWRLKLRESRARKYMGIYLARTSRVTVQLYIYICTYSSGNFANTGCTCPVSTDRPLGIRRCHEEAI